MVLNFLFSFLLGDSNLFVATFQRKNNRNASQCWIIIFLKMTYPRQKWIFTRGTSGAQCKNNTIVLFMDTGVNCDLFFRWRYVE